MVFMNTCGEESAICSFSNGDKICLIILNNALLKHLACQDLLTVANYLRQILIKLIMTNVT